MEFMSSSLASFGTMESPTRHPLRIWEGLSVFARLLAKMINDRQRRLCGNVSGQVDVIGESDLGLVLDSISKDSLIFRLACAPPIWCAR